MGPTLKLRGQHEKKQEKTQPTAASRQEPAPALPPPTKTQKKTQPTEARRQEPAPVSQKKQEKTQPAEEPQKEPALASPHPIPRRTAADPTTIAMVTKALVKSNEPQRPQTQQSNILERHIHTGDRRRYANDNNPFRPVSPLRAPRRSNLEGVSGVEMDPQDWPPARSDEQQPEVPKPAAAAAAQDEAPPSRPPVLSQVEACVQKVRNSGGIQTPMDEIKKMWQGLRRDGSEDGETASKPEVVTTRKENQQVEKLEQDRRENERIKKFWDKLDRTLGLHQVRSSEDREGDRKGTRVEAASRIYRVAFALLGVMTLNLIAAIVVPIVLKNSGKTTGEERGWTAWALLSIMGLLCATIAVFRARAMRKQARFDEVIARQRMVHLQRASSGLAPPTSVVGAPATNEHQAMRAGEGSVASTKVQG